MASIKLAYGSSSAVTITLASLATDTNLLAGRGSVSIDNTTNLYVDYLIAGKITTGTSPTGNPGTIEVHAVSLEDDSTWPDAITGTDIGQTLTNSYVKAAICRPVAILSTNTTSNVAYWFGAVSLASLFGGSCPKKFALWVAHSSGVNLNAAAGNHDIKITPVYYTVA